MYWIVQSDNMWNLSCVAQVFLVHERSDIMPKMVINHQLRSTLCCMWAVWLITAIPAWWESYDGYWLSELGTLPFHVISPQFVLLSVIDTVYYCSCDIFHIVWIQQQMLGEERNIHLCWQKKKTQYALMVFYFISQKVKKAVILCLKVILFTYINSFLTTLYLSLYLLRWQ